MGNSVVIDIEKVKSIVVERLEKKTNVNEKEVYECIDKVLLEMPESGYIALDKKIRLRKELFHKIYGLDIVDELLEDDTVSEIMINGYENIFVEKNGEIEKLPVAFADKQRLSDIIQRIVSRINRSVNESSPIVDARLEDGSRVNVVLDPIAVNGPIVTIRKFSKDISDADKLIELGTINKELSNFFKELVIGGYNIFVSGATASGKTTFLNVLSGFIPSIERVITIEDSIELKLNNIENLVTMESRNQNAFGENKVSIRDLIKTSLRMRPDRVIVGEVRGDECIDMLQAMNTGHDGSMSTGHANSPQDMLLRLETMVLMGTDIPISAVRNQIAAGIDLIVHLSRYRDGSRKVSSVCEVIGIRGGEILLNPIYEFVERGEDEYGKILGEFVKRGELKRNSKLERVRRNK